jgi:diguanylate cyclase (GGDEF)-like protein
MGEENIFEGEERIIREAETLLAAGDARDTLLAPHYRVLLKRYKRLFNQTKRMVKMADLMQKDLNLATQKLEALSNIDGLTGVANRRCLDAALEREWHLARRAGQPLAVLLTDVDHFKEFNDLYGHQEGDECLRRVAQTIRAGLRRTGDLAARYGGEEFAVLLHATDLAGAAHIAEGLRAGVEALCIEHRGASTCGIVTISVGAAAVVPGAGLDGEGCLVGLADAALYEAKRRGRNQVVAAGPAAATPRAPGA